jgi:hypothetical protein
MRRFRQKGRSRSIAKIAIFSAGKNDADSCEQLEADTPKVLASAVASGEESLDLLPMLGRHLQHWANAQFGKGSNQRIAKLSM